MVGIKAVRGLTPSLPLRHADEVVVGALDGHECRVFGGGEGGEGFHVRPLQFLLGGVHYVPH